MEFAYSLAMYAPPDMYRKPPRKPSEAPSQLSTTTNTNTNTTTTTTTTTTNNTTTTTTTTTASGENSASPRTTITTTTHNNRPEITSDDDHDDQDDQDDDHDDDTSSNSTTKNNYSTASASVRASARASVGASPGANPNSTHPPSTSAATEPSSSSSSYRLDHSVRRFRRSSRRRAASATTAATSTTSHASALASVSAAIDSSRHSRTSSSSGASSRTSHEAPPSRSLLQAFRPSSNKRHTTGSEIPPTLSPLTTSPAASTVASSPSPSTTHSASASQSESLAASLKSPRQIRPGPLHFFRRRDSHQRKSDASQLPPTPTSPIYAPAGSLSASRPSRLNESRYQHDISASLSSLSKYYSPSSRYDSVSSASVTASSVITSVMSSHEQLPVAAGGSASVSTASASTSSKAPSVGPKPLVTRNNRTYIHEPTLAYPLPVDLSELHRQSLRTLLLFQLFGGPIISTAFANKPPSRVLEVGCGSAFWSMMCHRYFAQHGHASISFTGIDIVPLAGAGLDPETKPDKDMRWRFVQHDIRRLPCPFPDEEFDLIMVKDMSLSVSFRDNQPLFEEYLRMLKPGGVVEVWETDHTIRMLRPNVLKAPKPSRPSSDSDSSSDDDDDDDANVERLGAYLMTTNTPLSTPLNPFLVEYNAWATKALELRGLSAVPCTLIGPHILQESEILTDVRSKRLAVPLSEIRWEREGVGGVVTKDGKSYIDSMKGKSRPSDMKGAKSGGKALTPGQAALRRTALESTVGLILGLEPLLREASGKSQDEWDSWTGKMTNDLLRDGGTNCGECLEVGAWTARKRSSKTA
ncbi:hypothetical protein F4809DRAFT_315903 [Biscogniauxia mediterranea]|nr:hypothetical protein F4809DRAFT_315903 [Biscogniauxia mediterranea]